MPNKNLAQRKKERKDFREEEKTRDARNVIFSNGWGQLESGDYVLVLDAEKSNLSKVLERVGKEMGIRYVGEEYSRSSFNHLLISAENYESHIKPNIGKGVGGK